MEQNKLAELLGKNQAQVAIAMTLLVRAITKQPGIDKENFIADLLNLLPEPNQDEQNWFLTTWRQVLAQNF